MNTGAYLEEVASAATEEETLFALLTDFVKLVSSIPRQKACKRSQIDSPRSGQSCRSHAIRNLGRLPSYRNRLSCRNRRRTLGSSGRVGTGEKCLTGWRRWLIGWWCRGWYGAGSGGRGAGRRRSVITHGNVRAIGSTYFLAIIDGVVDICSLHYVDCQRWIMTDRQKGIRTLQLDDKQERR